MSRVKRGNVARNRRKKVLKITKGFRGALSKLYRPANQAALHALSHMYRDRRNRKRQFRALWIQRVNAGVREHGLSYSAFMKLAQEKQLQVNRKMLSELAIHHASVFRQIIDHVQA